MGSEYVASVMYAVLPSQRRTLGAISIVDGNVCVNMWETMRYPCGVGHMGTVRVCWHEGSRNGIVYLFISCVCLQVR